MVFQKQILMKCVACVLVAGTMQVLMPTYSQAANSLFDAETISQQTKMVTGVVKDQKAVALTAEQPVPVTAVAAVLDHNTSGIISMKDKGIDSFDKLEGKTYALPGTCHRKRQS